ncbi:MAG TPA: DUF1800 domain-containing protein [Terriglobia bacterium]|nr:DUF1800 domain-containing protein [Terriglobia bacterium]
MRDKTIRPIVLVLLLLLLVTATAVPAPQKSPEEQKITHVLNRVAFGARPGDAQRVHKMGIRAYIEEQLHPDRISDALADERVAALDSLTMGRSELFNEFPDRQQVIRQLGIRPNQKNNSNPSVSDQQNQAQTRAKVQQFMTENMLKRPQQLLQQLISNRIVRGVHSERQLQEVMTDFWFNHFNIFWDKGADRWLTTDFEMTVIRPRVFGKFQDLLLATAQSPAMLFYLDNHLSSTPEPAQQAGRKRPNANNNKRAAGINENYARELMELHTMGVDGGYTQKDVTEVARALTGWTIDQPRMNGSFVFRPQMHDRGEKTVLGHRIQANGGMQDGIRVIDILAHHPSTARFISTKLVRRFVSDDPPQSLVDRVTATYMKTDGDISEMLRTIFYSEEFMSSDSYGQKMKSPFEYVVSSIRALNGQTNGGQQVGRLIAQMGQPLYQYQAPTGFPDRAEFWMSDGALIARLNYAVALTSGRMPEVRVDTNGFKDAQAAALYIGSPDFQKR